MPCCQCCCGGVTCVEGQQGKCCCGGASGTCCSESQYCCSGVCQSDPCDFGCAPYGVSAGLECSGLSITWLFGEANTRFVHGPTFSSGGYTELSWLVGWPDGTFASTPSYDYELCKFNDVNFVAQITENFFTAVYREFWTFPGGEFGYGAPFSISKFVLGSFPDPECDPPDIQILANPLP